MQDETTPPQQDRLDLLLMSDEELVSWERKCRQLVRVCQEERMGHGAVNRWFDELDAVQRELSYRDDVGLA